MRRCVICGFKVVKNLCNRCYRKYCRDENGNLIVHKEGDRKAKGKGMQSRYPEWILELIKLENHNYYQAHVKNEAVVKVSYEEEVEKDLRTNY